MNCSISGQAAEEPVVSKNGDIFEKRLIVKHIEINGTCPVTDEPLSLEDLIPLRVSNVNAVKPRQIASASIPGLLLSFQNEWDALMLETFNLKKQLEKTREELAHALYQSDASCRVIARLIKENETSQKEYEELKRAVGRGVIPGDKMSILPGLSAPIRNQFALKSKQLSAKRKGMQPSSSTASIEQIKGFKQVASFPPHKTHSPGVLSVDIHPVRQELTVTGGVDKTAVLFNRVTGKKEATLTGHTKKVTCTLFHPTSPGVFTGSADHTVKIWSSQDSGDKPRHTISLHSGEIVSLSLHATNEYIVSASADRTWAIHNIETGQSLLQVSDPDDSPLTCAMLHPDGMILAAGTADDLVRIWDLKDQKIIAAFRGHKGAISDLKFSENGYYLATAAQDNILKLWDLRGPKNINSLKLESSVVALDYDLSGKYLAAAMGSEIRVFTGKNLEHVRTFADHTQTVTGVKWGANAQFLASTSMDRSLKFWS